MILEKKTELKKESSPNRFLRIHFNLKRTNSLRKIKKVLKFYSSKSFYVYELTKTL